MSNQIHPYEPNRSAKSSAAVVPHASFSQAIEEFDRAWRDQNVAVGKQGRWSVGRHQLLGLVGNRAGSRAVIIDDSRKTRAAAPDAIARIVDVVETEAPGGEYGAVGTQ